jgi:FeS assembly protein IscX
MRSEDICRGETCVPYGAPQIPQHAPWLNADCFAQELTMPKSLTWDDPQDIGILLSETHPEIDPLSVRFTDLHRYVTELPGFTGDPKTSNEGKLEAIQMAWHEEVQDRTQG